MTEAAESLWAMLYVNDVGIVARATENLQEYDIDHRACYRFEFGLMVSESKTEIMYSLPKWIEECSLRVEAGGEVYE